MLTVDTKQGVDALDMQSGIFACDAGKHAHHMKWPCLFILFASLAFPSFSHATLRCDRPPCKGNTNIGACAKSADWIIEATVAAIEPDGEMKVCDTVTQYCSELKIELVVVENPVARKGDMPGTLDNGTLKLKSSSHCFGNFNLPESVIGKKLRFYGWNKPPMQSVWAHRGFFMVQEIINGRQKDLSD